MAKCDTSMSHEAVVNALKYVGDDIIDFANERLRDNQPRADNTELLELVIIFLGEFPSRGLKFKRPWATHHARCMVKAVYSFEIPLTIHLRTVYS